MQRVQIAVICDDDLLPKYATLNSSGADLMAAILEEMVVSPGKSALVPTGLFLEIPPGVEAQIRPRSGLALKNQITVLNTPGTIDADYRGEIKVILINHGLEPFHIQPKMRIAQIVFASVIKAEFIQQENLALSVRSGGGFGHTGV